MPIYEFENEATGDIVELYFQANWEPPKIGEVIEGEDGARLRRLVSRPSKGIVKDYFVKAWSQPEWAEGADAYTPTGTPVFTSKASIQRYLDHQNRKTETDGEGEQGGEILGYDGKTTL